jgi:hypothetical protein
MPRNFEITLEALHEPKDSDNKSPEVPSITETWNTSR